MKDRGEKSHAESNADAHADTILELYRAWKQLDEGEKDTVEADGCDFTDASELIDHARDGILSLEVRENWHAPGENGEINEFNILLTTGGPALRIVGGLGSCGRPSSGAASFQIQDWGIPWTDYNPKAASENDWDDAFDWYLNLFYYGE